MGEWQINKCLELQEKAQNLIPGMTQLFSKRPDLFSLGVWPTYFKEAKGSHVIDLDGNEYVDCSCGGIGATVLGYADEDVNRAVANVVATGSACSLNPPEEVALAEKLIELHPWADMARFARSGGEAMAIAVRIARAYSKRDVVLYCGYHGCMDWYLASNVEYPGMVNKELLGFSSAGIPKAMGGTAIPFLFNDVESFRRAVKAAGENLGAIVLEPIRNFAPTQEFMDAIHTVARETDTPFIMDEITAAFRICNGGAHLKLGWQPDVAVFAKALGNGYPMSAIIGKRKVMVAVQDTFTSSTNWTERIGPAAALAMIEKFVRVDASTHMMAIAKRVKDGWEQLGAKYNQDVHVTGSTPLWHLGWNTPDDSVNRAFYTQEMLKRGYLAGGLFYAMYAHTHEEIDGYLAATEEIFAMVEKYRGTIADRLIGQPAGKGFKRIN